MRIIAVAAAAALVFCPASTTVADSEHQATAAQPAFRTGVDLLTLQAGVLDKAGRPVTDLTPDDFAVSIEGKPRKVLFARFRRTGSSSNTAPAPAIPSSTAASYADNNATAESAA